MSILRFHFLVWESRASMEQGMSFWGGEGIESIISLVAAFVPRQAGGAAAPEAIATAPEAIGRAEVCLLHPLTFPLIPFSLLPLLSCGRQAHATSSISSSVMTVIKNSPKSGQQTFLSPAQPFSFWSPSPYLLFVSCTVYAT